MPFLQKEKLFTLRWFKEYSFITIGAFILAVGFVYFISPHKIVPGGVYGIAIVVHYLTAGMFSFWPDGIPIGLFGLIHEEKRFSSFPSASRKTYSDGIDG